MTKRRTPLSQALSARVAFEHMRRGSALVHMHSSKATGYHWFVVPGGAVSDATANEIRTIRRSSEDGTDCSRTTTRLGG